MAHAFKFEVTVTVERTQGKFASRADIADEIRAELENADPGSLSGLGADGDSVYEVTEFSVDQL